MVFTNIWVRGIYPRPRIADVVLDLGANVGIFTAYAVRSKAAHVYCVEPCPDSVARLEDNLNAMAARDRATIYSAAVGERDTVAFIGTRNHVGNQLRFEESADVTRVRVVDAARLFDDLHPTPTYIKLDIESREAAVLRRLSSGLRFGDVRVVAMEVPADEVSELARFLDGLGFAVQTRSWPEPLVIGERHRR
jgi:FkbM family methyltransferase